MAGLVISTRLDPSQSVQFLSLCDRLGLDRSEFLRDLLLQAVAADSQVCNNIGEDYTGEFKVRVDLLEPILEEREQ
jgi:hypothetical protein